MFALLISEGKIEDSCNGNHTCHENLVCFQNETTNSSVCQCPSDSYKLNDTACTPKRKIGESCNVNETCHEGFECRDDTNNGSVCQCPSDYYEQNDTTCAPKRKIGESCNVNETCHEGLECRDDTNNGSVCQCPSDYYEQNDTTCAPKKRHGDSCNESLECISSLTCLEKVCRCQSKERFSGNSCYSVDDFQVTNITSTSTSDSVMLTWQTKKHGLSVDYSITIDPTPSADTTIPANFSGGTVDGLTPGTKYTFTIISTIKEDNVYPETTTNKTYEVVTKQQHAGFCNESVECISSLTCLGKVCRCQSEERFSGNSCYSVDDFQVTNITSTSTSDSVMLTWQTKKHGLSVDYSITIDPTPSADRTIPANFSGGTVDGLTSGTKYTFTIISTIKEDNVYPEMTTNKEYDVVTRANSDAIGALQGRIDLIEDSLEQQERYSRRENIILHGVPEDKKRKSYDHEEETQKPVSPICGEPSDDDYIYRNITDDKILNSPISEDEVRQGIKSLKNNKSPGPEQQHAGPCNESLECISSLTCLEKVCRCPSEERFSGNSCYRVDAFQVTNITSTSTSDSVMLTWQTKKHELSVAYNITIDPTPSADTTITANFSGGTVDGLTPGTNYKFTIISTIMGDDVYPETTTNKTYECGDVELNPRPTIEAQLTDRNKNIEDKFEKLHNEICGLGFEMRKMATALEVVTLSVNSIKEEIRDLRENINKVYEKQEHLQLDTETNAAGSDKLELQLEALSNSVEKQEQYSRRENLILHGIKEEADESTEKSRVAVVALLNRTVTTKHWREEDFLRAHKLGRIHNSSETPRPLIVRFMHHFDKLKVLRARDKLKETGIGVAYDLTLHQRTELAKLRKQGKSAYNKNRTLIIQYPSTERNKKIT
ncbi:hypothetical protein RRG08_059646 [Elysia crispata]|uniref:Fibronectin type-III domain-containing protein n=1 Tax=Elysia crispata TaxID=231223 RepID=A0AAE0Z3C8_9GAST|nr:hypothetical protein RRG08_059646 [Elysia crispata]